MTNIYRAPEFSLRWTPVWRRNLLVWRKLAIASILGNIADPLLYMLAIGYGIGSFIPEMNGMKYIAFIGTGMVCQSAMFTASFEGMYSAFSRREQVVNMLEVRAGNPPSAVEMLLRFHRNQGLEKLSEYWKIWEAWFADIEESHTTLSALVFFRSPRAENSWVTAAGAVLDAAAITLSAIEIPYEVSAALCIRAGFLAFHRIADYFDVPHPHNPHYPDVPICVERAEFDSVLDQLAQAGLPLKPDRELAWKNFAGWRVNYDRSLILLCGLVMAPSAPWSGDRIPGFKLPPFFILKKKLKQAKKIKA